MGSNRNGRIVGRDTYDSVIKYIGKIGDANAEFYAIDLESTGGLLRLTNGKIIKIVRREGYKKRNVYKLGDGMAGLGLDYVLRLDYTKAMKMFNNK